MQATVATPTARGRYTVEERWGASGPGDRCLGTDQRLRRTVLLWTVSAPDGDPRRTALIGLARRAARLTHPGFLRVLDIVLAADTVTVALEAPSGPRLTPEQFQRGGMTARHAAAAVLSAGRALADAARAGVRVHALPFTHLYGDEASGLRLDPIGVLDDRGGTVPSASSGALLAGLLAALLPHGGRAFTGSGTTDEDAVRALLANWQAQGDDGTPAAFRRMLAALEPLAAAAGADPAHAAGTAATQPLPRASADATTRLQPAAPPATQPLPAATLPPPPVQRRRFGRLRAALLAGVVIGALAYGTAAGWLPGSGGAEPNDDGRPAATVPADRATLQLTAEKDARIRITVDGSPVFSGVLRAGESKSWLGERRVQVWTSDGKVLQVTVNGHQLGALSQAVGHPEWNTVDWGWPAGWTP